MTYIENPTKPGTSRLPTLEVKVGDLTIGNFHPVRIQTMTTTDTMDTVATVDQVMRCADAGAELVRITAPSQHDAENLLNIKNSLRRNGYKVPLVADIHFTPNAAEIAARIVEKVRINPGNYADKKKFETLEYTEAAYEAELERIRQRFTPLVNVCREYGTALRIGTNHGSLSDRIMNRYGDTPIGMVESAMEFLRIAESLQFNNIVLSMKASRPMIMIQAYRLLVQAMQDEFGYCYPLHLGVTEAGEGEAGRIKSAIGIGTLLEEGLGDTIRVSLTEDPEYELPVCQSLVNLYAARHSLPVTNGGNSDSPDKYKISRRITTPVGNIGGENVPVVVADLRHLETIEPEHLEAIGYSYETDTGSWKAGLAAADYVYANEMVSFSLPETLQIILPFTAWQSASDKREYVPLFTAQEFNAVPERSHQLNFVVLHAAEAVAFCQQQHAGKKIVLALSGDRLRYTEQVFQALTEMERGSFSQPCILQHAGAAETGNDLIISHAAALGNLLLHGIGDGIWLTPPSKLMPAELPATLNSISFGILQATHTRITGTEYISCPSCGRTLFNLQETTARINEATHHLVGVRIAVMGCIVNGPGEMADADFGYVGSGAGKISLYKGKEIIKRNIGSDVAVAELINLIREHGMWTPP